MLDIAHQIENIGAHPVAEHAFMTVEGGVRAIDLGDHRGPAYAFHDDIGCTGVIAPGIVDHVPQTGETFDLTGGWSYDLERDGPDAYTFVGIGARVIH